MNTPRRIALLTLAVPWHDRPAIGLYNVAQAKALRELGVETELFTVAPCLPHLARHLGGPWARQLARPARYAHDGVPINTLRCPVAYPHSIRTHVAPRAPQAVTAGFCAATRTAFRAAFDRFRPDALIVHGMLPWCHVAALHSHERRIPTVVIEHSADDVRATARHRSLGRFVAKHIGRFTAVAAVNSRLTGSLQKLGAPHATVLTNGISQRPHIVNAHDRVGFTVLTAGQFITRKGHADLIAAFAKADIPRAKLRIVGAPPPALRRQIQRELPPDTVELLPMLGNEALMAEMANSDLFALPSWSESFGLVFAEALSVGTPILATTDAGIADHVQSGKHGWLVPPRDLDAIAECLRIASRMPRAARRSMGAQGRQFAMQAFTWKKNAESVLGALSSPASNSTQLQLLQGQARVHASPP